MNREIERGGAAHPEFSVPPPGIRYHYMDNLRALAMLAGIFFHAALAYSPMLNNLWLSSSPDNAAVMDIVSWFTHLFRMPLFFLIAGFFSCYLVAKRGVGGLLKNRALRIALPFTLFLPLLWVSFGKGIEWALANVETMSPMLGMIKLGSMMPEPPPPPPPTTTHLWFLYNLCQFYLVYVVLEKTGLLAKLGKVLVSTPFLLFVMPVLVAAALVGQWAPHPAPEQFTPQPWAFGFYGLFFLVGAQFFRQQDLIERIQRWAPWLLLSSVGLYAVLFSLLPKSINLMEAMAAAGQGAPLSARQAGTALLEGTIAVHMTLVCLVLGKRFLDRANPAVRYIADSSYWVYIIHLPLLFFIQYLLLDVSWGLWAEFVVSSFGTLAIGIVTYTLFVRWTPIGWLLNGRRRKAAAPASAVVGAAAASGPVSPR